MSTMQGPNFICIGMPRAGTGWLFDQLQYHPDFWMPPTKEMDYLLRDVSRLKNVSRKYALLQREPERVNSRKVRKGIPHRRRPWDTRDAKFLELANSYRGQPRDIERNYISLFQYKGVLKSGDVSPTYISLTEDVIAEIASFLPHTKVIFLVRDPVARAFSQISMAYRHGKFDCSILNEPGEFRCFLETSVSTKEQAFPTAIIARWKKYAPSIIFRTFLFDLIESEPERARHEILTYLEADPAKQSGTLPAGHNRKAQLEKLVFPDRARQVLVDHFSDEIRRCAETLAGPARGWLARYGL